MKMRWVVSCVALAMWVGGVGLHAADAIKGRVTEAGKETVKVVADGARSPVVGDRVEISMEIPGLEEGAVVADGSVAEVTGDAIIVRVDKTLAEVEKGQLAKIYSKEQEGAGAQSPAASSSSAGEGRGTTGGVGAFEIIGGPVTVMLKLAPPRDPASVAKATEEALKEKPDKDDFYREANFKPAEEGALFPIAMPHGYTMTENEPTAEYLCAGFAMAGLLKGRYDVPAGAPWDFVRLCCTKVEAGEKPMPGDLVLWHNGGGDEPKAEGLNIQHWAVVDERRPHERDPDATYIVTKHWHERIYRGKLSDFNARLLAYVNADGPYLIYRIKWALLSARPTSGSAVVASAETPAKSDAGLVTEKQPAPTTETMPEAQPAPGAPGVTETPAATTMPGAQPAPAAPGAPEAPATAAAPASQGAPGVPGGGGMPGMAPIPGMMPPPGYPPSEEGGGHPPRGGRTPVGAPATTIVVVPGTSSGGGFTGTKVDSLGGKGILAVVVQDQEGTAVQGATVRLITNPAQSRSTANSGSANFIAQVGQAQVVVDPPTGSNLEAGSGQATVKASDVTPLVVRLKGKKSKLDGKGILKVSVQDEDGKPVESATVRLIADQGQTRKTGASGSVNLICKPGQARVEVDPPKGSDLETGSGQATVKADGVASVVVKLKGAKKTIRITDPADGTTVTTPSVSVAVKCEKITAKEIGFLINGSEKARVTIPGQSFRASLQLTAGRNEIQATDGKVKSNTVVVNVEKPKAAWDGRWKGESSYASSTSGFASRQGPKGTLPADFNVVQKGNTVSFTSMTAKQTATGGGGKTVPTAVGFPQDLLPFCENPVLQIKAGNPAEATCRKQWKWHAVNVDNEYTYTATAELRGDQIHWVTQIVHDTRSPAGPLRILSENKAVLTRVGDITR